jgi:hypothetical protein
MRIPGNDDSGNDYGKTFDGQQSSVYAFQRDDDGWTPHMPLPPENTPSERANYAESVALDGSTAFLNSGDILFRDEETWQHETSLSMFEDSYASAVDGDGGTAIFGVLDPHVGSVEGTKAFVFEKRDGDWRREATLRPPEIERGDMFGNAIAFDSSSVVVGAKRTIRDDRPGSGGAYLFDQVDRGWKLQKRFLPPVAGRVGTSVALDGETALIGAPETSVDTTDEVGQVDVLTRGDEGWERETTLFPPVKEWMRFGSSVALSESLALVGAPLLNPIMLESSDAEGVPEETGHTTDRPDRRVSGAVFAFDRESWTHQATYTATNPKNGEFFGTAVAVKGDTAIVGGRIAHRRAGRFMASTHLVSL